MQAALAGLMIYHNIFSDIKTYILLTMVTMASSLIYSSDSSSHIIKTRNVLGKHKWQAS